MRPANGDLIWMRRTGGGRTRRARSHRWLAHSARPSPRYTAPMIARPTRSDLLLLGVFGIMWGTSYAFIKLGVATLPTFTLIATRLAIGLTLLVTVVVVTRTTLPRDRRSYAHLFVMPLIIIVIPFTLITSAERSVDSAIAAILNGAVPLIVIVLAALVFHDEPITLNRLVGVLVGYVGVIVLVLPGLTSS